MTDITSTQATIAQLFNLGLVAGSRADLAPLGAVKTALDAASQRWFQLGGALERGVDISVERFTQEVTAADADMADAAASALPAQAAKLIAAFTA